jgi:cytochrome c oxidase subunit I+III
LKTLPNPLPRPPGELERLERAWQAPRGWRFVFSVNNTDIGLFYLGTALAFFIAAGVLGLLIRAQLALPGNTLLAPHTYNQVFTMHGTVMMFLFAVPVVEAMAVYLLPGMLGARDLPFPRLSAYAFWAYAIGGTAFFATLLFGVAPDGGWTMYAPLTGKAHSPGLGADFWLLGIGFIEISAIAGAVELIVGILMTRTPGMTLARMPVYAWAMLVVGLMIVFAFPAIIAGTALLELERAFDWPFFIAERGGEPLVWQHLFWFFGHPEVYIIFLPAAGLVSMMVPVLARTPLLGERAVVAALAAVGVISFALWAHHMFTAGLSRWSLALASAASLLVALPSTLQVFAWIGTLARGQLVRNTSAWSVLAFVALFVIGGLTGVMVAVLPFNRHVHDTHFIVAHLHYVLIGGMVFPLLAALYHWLPLVNGQRLSERLGRWVVGLMFVGFNLAFLPMHASGLLGMPRRVSTYADDPGWFGLNAFNAVSSIGAFVLALGVLLCAIDVVRTLRKPKRAHGDPWRGATLEWLPTQRYGLRSLPQVDSAHPLWTRPALHHEVPAGAHWLPGNATGRREALVTRMRDAEPRYLMLLPGDGALPLVAAAGTAGFFLLLTVGWTVPAWLCGAVALAAIAAWLWGLDRDAGRATVALGRERVVPVGGDGGIGHALVALAVVLTVDASIYLSFLYTHVHLAMAAPLCPPPGAALPAGATTACAVLAWAAAALCVEVGARRLHRRGATAAWPIAAALLLSVAAFAAHGLAQQQAGLDPRRDAWSASVAVLLSYDGLHMVWVAAAAVFALARRHAGLLSQRHRVAFDTLRWAVHAGALQAVFGALVVRALPQWLG